MKHDSLRELLSAADAKAAAAPESVEELAGRVRRTARRRKRVRKVTLTILGIEAATALILAIQLAGRDGKELAVVRPTPSAAEVAAMRSEIERLRAEAGEREEIVARMLAAESGAELRRARAARRHDVLEPAEEFRLQRDKAASILVQSAERAALVPARRASAAAEYRRVVELFPQTAAAETAKRRLDEMAI